MIALGLPLPPRSIHSMAVFASSARYFSEDRVKGRIVSTTPLDCPWRLRRHWSARCRAAVSAPLTAASASVAINSSLSMESTL